VMAIRQKTDRTCFPRNGRMGFLRFDRPGITGVMPSWRVPVISLVAKQLLMPAIKLTHSGPRHPLPAARIIHHYA
jgi:hypothetical protein